MDTIASWLPASRPVPSYDRILEEGVLLYRVGSRIRVFMLPDHSCWWVERIGRGRDHRITDRNTMDD